MGEQTVPLEPGCPEPTAPEGRTGRGPSAYQYVLSVSLSLPISSIGPYIDLSANRVAKLHCAVFIYRHFLHSHTPIKQKLGGPNCLPYQIFILQCKRN
jgi:hypothetical protein